MKKKLLLVEDSIHDAGFTKHALQACGLENAVIHAVDGAEGLQVLLDDPAIALVLLDLKLPKVDGFEFLKIIRHDPRFVALPVIVVTTSSIVADRTRAELLGANGFVTKAFDLNEFNALIATAVKPYQSALADDAAPPSGPILGSGTLSMLGVAQQGQAS
jgi:CheY-like chemotaxis protein